MKDNKTSVLKSVHLLLDESEEIVLMQALHMHAAYWDTQPDCLEKRLIGLASYSLLKKLGSQLYEKERRKE